MATNKSQSRSGSINLYDSAKRYYDMKRKLSAGPAPGEKLTLPYKMTCKGCTSVIAEGVKLNYEQREMVNSCVGSGRVWRFNVKCPCCEFEIIIETMHRRPWYVIAEGAERTPKLEKEPAPEKFSKLSTRMRIEPVPPNGSKGEKIYLAGVAKQHNAA